MSLQVFGRLLDVSEVEEAVIAALELWLPTYIAEVERQRGMTPESMPMPRSYSTVNEFVKWTEDQLPTIIVVSPGLAPTDPKREGDGTYRAWYRVGVAVIAAARDRETTRRISKLYIAAIRGAILQHAGLGDLEAAGIRWTNERNSDIPDEAGRTLGSGAVTFDIEMRGVINDRLGPAEPFDDPYDDPTWPTVATTDVDVIEKED